MGKFKSAYFEYTKDRAGITKYILDRYGTELRNYIKPIKKDRDRLRSETILIVDELNAAVSEHQKMKCAERIASNKAMDVWLSRLLGAVRCASEDQQAIRMRVGNRRRYKPGYLAAHVNAWPAGR